MSTQRRTRHGALPTSAHLDSAYRSPIRPRSSTTPAPPAHPATVARLPTPPAASTVDTSRTAAGPGSPADPGSSASPRTLATPESSAGAEGSAGAESSVVSRTPAGAGASAGAGRRRFLGLLSGGALAVAGCGTADGREGAPPTTLRYQGWAGTVTPAELAEDLEYVDDVPLTWVGNTTSGPQDIQAAAPGEVDFGGAFNGAVVRMAAAKAPVTAVVSYYGMDEKRFNGFYAPASTAPALPSAAPPT